MPYQMRRPIKNRWIRSLIIAAPMNFPIFWSNETMIWRIESRTHGWPHHAHCVIKKTGPETDTHVFTVPILFYVINASTPDIIQITRLWSLGIWTSFHEKCSLYLVWLLRLCHGNQHYRSLWWKVALVDPESDRMVLISDRFIFGYRILLLKWSSCGKVISFQKAATTSYLTFTLRV